MFAIGPNGSPVQRFFGADEYAIPVEVVDVVRRRWPGMTTLIS